ncbi:hypothetical protein O6H91_02G052200 [Diphasiastrum complanatum]|uniref:Uncharacterized protein n=1 Tax=Diphasiastrum complanatum TaxID=34168 RepID=A0ACC2EFE3_DIPCM|nr:hypothetical protein O6H91_02G052200 [Diphasiastrum complanatum]
MVVELLVFGAVGLLAIVLYVVSWRLRHFCCKPERDEEEGDAGTEQLITIPEDCAAGQTLRRAKSGKHEDASNGAAALNLPKYENSRANENNKERHPAVISADASSKRSNLVLEVISGPSAGISIAHEPLQGVTSVTVGRISQNHLVLNDPEVSGKHALITWNSQASKWELVDMGSLNGTLLNYRSISAAQLANASVRQRGAPVGLSNGDIVTLGSTSQVLVRISSSKISPLSGLGFGVGVAADPMAIRKGGKQMPMEDVCLCEWPLRGVENFGVFCIFDGHGGVGAAEAARKIMPQKLSNILAVESNRIRVISKCDATEVLRDAFKQTEEALVHEYEGCTATVLLLWRDGDKGYYAQCANVGDSTCIFSVGGNQVIMTEDHRLTSTTERSRLLAMGKHLRDGENRLCVRCAGMNIVRALGDKFLKAQERCFSAEPYISRLLRITSESKALAVLASDGLWDVLSPKRAMSLALEARDGLEIREGRRPVPLSAEEIAQLLLNNARLLRTKDNTTVVVLDLALSTEKIYLTV